MRFCSGKNLALSLVVLLIATPVLADTIDGNWCSVEGLHVSIKGPAVVTPSGAQLLGDYSRHNFSYIAPAGEPDAGAKVLMRLAGETRVFVSIEGKAGEPQLWKRCEQVS